MRNLEIAAVFNEIADLLEILGANPFRVRAYRKAATNIEGLTQSIEDVALRNIAGIGEDLASKIEEYLQTGKLAFHEQLKQSVPPILAKLVDIPSVGPKTAKEIYDQFRIATIEDLEELCKTDKLLSVPGIKQKTIDNIARGIEIYRRKKENYLLGRTLPIAMQICKYLEASAERVAYAGSLRRMKEIVHDVDILAASANPEKTMKAFLGMPMIESVLAQGGTKASVRLQDGDLQVDLRVIEPKSWGAAMHYFTGSKAHNIRMRERAIKQGLKLNEYGLFDAEDKFVAGTEEEEVFQKLGLPFIPPVLREDQGEMEAAAEGRLPNIIELGDIRGDLHMHTTWSDGKYSTKEMIEAARKRGYKYVAITDHSKSLGVAAGLSDDATSAARRRDSRARSEVFRHSGSGWDGSGYSSGWNAGLSRRVAGEAGLRGGVDPFGIQAGSGDADEAGGACDAESVCAGYCASDGTFAWRPRSVRAGFRRNHERGRAYEDVPGGEFEFSSAGFE